MLFIAPELFICSRRCPFARRCVCLLWLTDQPRCGVDCGALRLQAQRLGRGCVLPAARLCSRTVSQVLHCVSHACWRRTADPCLKLCGAQLGVRCLASRGCSLLVCSGNFTIDPFNVTAWAFATIFDTYEMVGAPVAVCVLHWPGMKRCARDVDGWWEEQTHAIFPYLLYGRSRTNTSLTGTWQSCA